MQFDNIGYRIDKLLARLQGSVQTVVIVSQKGGTGKTTLAVHLAVEAELDRLPGSARPYRDQSALVVVLVLHLNRVRVAHNFRMNFVIFFGGEIQDIVFEKQIDDDAYDEHAQDVEMHVLPFSHTDANLYGHTHTCLLLSSCFVESSFIVSMPIRSELLSPQTTTGELSAGASPLPNGASRGMQTLMILPGREFRPERLIMLSRNHAPLQDLRSMFNDRSNSGRSATIPRLSKHV